MDGRTPKKRWIDCVSRDIKEDDRRMMSIGKSEREKLTAPTTNNLGNGQGDDDDNYNRTSIKNVNVCMFVCYAETAKSIWMIFSAQIEDYNLE
ncbi:unnamed protein product, partial [Brenthis ino]